MSPRPLKHQKAHSKTKTLTRKNYYGPDRIHLSYSQIKDFLRSRELFLRRHILKDLPFEETAAVRIGKAVDALVFHEPFPYQVKVLKKDNPQLFEEQKDAPDTSFMTQTEFETAHILAAKVTAQPFYQFCEEKKYIRYQYPLERHVSKIATCGLADIASLSPSKPFVADLKTTNYFALKDAQSWVRQCYDMKYFMQMGHYQEMLAQELCLPREQVRALHLVTALSPEGLPQVFLFEIPQQYLDHGRLEFDNGIRLLNEHMDRGLQAFKDPLFDLEDAIPLP